MLLSLNSKEDLTAANLKKLNNLLYDKNTVVLNHATWCGACSAFKPDWSEFKKNTKANLVEIESSALEGLKENQKLYKRVTPKDNSVYFPMIIVFIKKETKASAKKLYEGSRNASEIQNYVSMKTQKPKTTKSKKST